MILAAQDLSYTYTREKMALDRLTFQVSPQAVTFVLGSNGSGKTTLLQCLCGVRRATAGKVTLDGVLVDRIRLRERARTIAYVPQMHEPVFAYTVWEVVLMGRTPHLDLLARPRKADWEAAAQALHTVGLSKLRDRPYTQTSGGERRLALIARGLAQEAQILLLDEPDAHLDPSYQHRILSRVQALARGGVTVVVTSHSPNNALLYADALLFLSQGIKIAAGPPRTALTRENLELAYKIRFEMIEDGDGRRAVLPALDHDQSS